MFVKTFLLSFIILLTTGCSSVTQSSDISDTKAKKEKQESAPFFDVYQLGLPLQGFLDLPLPPSSVPGETPRLQRDFHDGYRIVICKFDQADLPPAPVSPTLLFFKSDSATDYELYRMVSEVPFDALPSLVERLTHKYGRPELEKPLTTRGIVHYEWYPKEQMVRITGNSNREKYASLLFELSTLNDAYEAQFKKARTLHLKKDQTAEGLNQILREWDESKRREAEATEPEVTMDAGTCDDEPVNDE